MNIIYDCKYSKTTKRIISLILITAFVCTSVTIPDLPAIQAIQPVNQQIIFQTKESISLIEKIRESISSDMIVETVSDKKNGKAPIILIRDLHCHEEAQKTIARTIKRLNTDLSIQNVFIEGAHGKLDMDFYRAFPKQSTKERVGGQFVKEGLLTGAEYVLFCSQLSTALDLYGAEDVGIYIANLKAYRDAKKEYDEKISVIEGVHEAFEEIISKRFDESLQELYRYMKSHRFLNIPTCQLQSDQIT